MDVLNDSFGSYQRCRGLDGCLLCHLSLPVGCVNILFKVSDLDKFLYQVIQTFALLSSVVVILMVGTPFVSISLSQI